MSWSPIAPLLIGGWKKTNSAVSASTSAGSPRSPSRLSITLRPALLGLDWVKEGALIQVLSGGGNHAGMLRLEAGGGHLLRRVALAKPAGSAVSLVLPLPAGLKAGARHTLAAAHQVVAGAVEITLPWPLPAAQEQHPLLAGPAERAAAEPRSITLAREAADAARRRAGA